MVKTGRSLAGGGAVFLAVGLSSLWLLLNAIVMIAPTIAPIRLGPGHVFCVLGGIITAVGAAAATAGVVAASRDGLAAACLATFGMTSAAVGAWVAAFRGTAATDVAAAVVLGLAAWRIHQLEHRTDGNAGERGTARSHVVGPSAPD
jgi:hypothetical protein